ncbi:MAG: DUF2781 domain-containing protein [Deltaproteobacteria bacterium]|nr:DUF2781 domain-containing protein [Deltaproteobacteria bacterium]
MEQTIPLRERPLDIAFVVFFAFNFFFITYIVDIEQIMLPSLEGQWEYPLWPPQFFVDLIHWYGSNYDPVQMARPPWWRATIWTDSLFYGPYYGFAMYAFVKGKNWIRIPTFLWASSLITVVVVILFEETVGTHAAPNTGMVYALNFPWVAFPALAIARMWKSETPFTKA